MIISFQPQMNLGYTGANERRTAAELRALGNNIFLLEATKSLLEIITHH